MSDENVRCLPVLSRLICEQRNINWGFPEGLGNLPKQTEYSPVHMGDETIFEPTKTPPKELEVGVNDNDVDDNKVNEVGNDQQKDLESQERRVQSLECLTQMTPSSSRTPTRPFPTQSIPWGQPRRPRMFQKRPPTDSSSDDDSNVPPLETAPSVAPPSVKTRTKRVKVLAPDSTPPSPTILALNPKRARQPQTRSKSVKKFQGKI